MYNWNDPRPRYDDTPKQPLEWCRVRQDSPCPVCDKGDWCTITTTGHLACCMRIESEQAAKNGGWIHELAENPSFPALPLPKPKEYSLNAPDEYALLRENRCHDKFCRQAVELGITALSLVEIGSFWSQDRGGLIFPMYDEQWKTCGLRVRFKWGAKRSVPGSRNGLFVPDCLDHSFDGCLWVVEGPTDTAAMVHAGQGYVVGLPSAGGGFEILRQFIQNHLPGLRQVKIIRDKDYAGIRSADMLCQSMIDEGYESFIYETPCKDVREFVVKGARSDDFSKLEVVS